MNGISKQRVTNRQANEQTDDENYACHHTRLPCPLNLKKRPKPRMDGTHKPTKIPASLLSGPNTPNHREIENKKETKAAIKIM
jgi:hypothetical protein